MKKNLKNKEPNYREEKANKMILDKKEYFIQNNNDDKKGKNSNNIKQNKKDNRELSKKLEGEEKQKEISMKSIKLQEKLKKIFLDREKAKYKYNKQLIPEQLKYNSDEDESTFSVKNQDANNKNGILNSEPKHNDNNINSNFINNESNKDRKIDGEKKSNLNEKNKEKDLIIKEKVKNKNVGVNKNQKENNCQLDKIKSENDNNCRNNKEPDKYREKYYKLLSSKSTDGLEINKGKNSKNLQLELDNKISEKEKIKEFNKNEEEKIKKINVNIKLKKDDNKESILSRSFGEFEMNNIIKESNSSESNNKKNKINSNREKLYFFDDDNSNKKNVLKILELIKSKKNERELLVQKKDENIKRPKSFAQNVKEIGTKKSLNKEELKEEKTRNLNHIKTEENNHEIKPAKKIYKKNCKINRINSSYKKNNYLTENNKLKKKDDEKIIFSPMNMSNNENNLLSSNNKTNKFMINNRLQNINNKFNNDYKSDNLRNNLDNSMQNIFYRTSNKIKPIKKYEKPKISTNNNNILNSTHYNNKSLTKNINIFENETNSKCKYKESIIYSPNKKKIKKINSENNFKRKNKLIEDNNYYINKNSFLKENNEFSKSNYNIYGNSPNIHNYYNNSKIYLKNKFISIIPSFSINNNLNNNKMNEIGIDSNNNYFHKINNNKENQRNNKKINVQKSDSGFLNLSKKNKYIYQKNKLNSKSKIINNSMQDKEWNDSDNIDTGRIDDINYENLRLGTNEMTYSNNNNILKNSFLNLGDSYIKLYSENNTFYQPTETFMNGNNFNHIYKNKKVQNNIVSQNSSLYQRKTQNINISNSLNNNNYKRNYRSNNNSILINIDNVLIFEEKFNNIVTYLKKGLSIIKPCLDFWSYYYNSWIYEKFDKIFNDEDDSEIVKLFIKYLLLSIIICYSFYLKKEMINNLNYFLLQILEINYNSIMLIIQRIKNSIFPENQSNIFFPILTKLYIKYINNITYNDNNDNLLITEKLSYNNERIDLKIKNLLTRKAKDYFKILYNFYIDIKIKNSKEINEFFIKYILEEENINGSLFSSNYFINHNSSFTTINPPFLKTPNKKKFTLVLDLNETLINFKYEENGEGYVRIRPFLFGFLEEVSQLYELIVFTSSEKEYADKVIEAIEHERNYFDHVFYRQHTIIVGNDFVKDLTRIGRPLNSTIIIDNMPQNFKLQKENGILIKPFWGIDSTDRTLYDLMPILLDIAIEGGDVRNSLNKYRNEIIGKITSNITKKNYDS